MIRSETDWFCCSTTFPFRSCSCSWTVPNGLRRLCRSRCVLIRFVVDLTLTENWLITVSIPPIFSERKFCDVIKSLKRNQMPYQFPLRIQLQCDRPLIHRNRWRFGTFAAASNHRDSAHYKTIGVNTSSPSEWDTSSHWVASFRSESVHSLHSKHFSMISHSASMPPLPLIRCRHSAIWCGTSTVPSACSRRFVLSDKLKMRFRPQCHVPMERRSDSKEKQTESALKPLESVILQWITMSQWLSQSLSPSICWMIWNQNGIRNDNGIQGMYRLNPFQELSRLQIGIVIP